MRCRVHEATRSKSRRSRIGPEALRAAVLALALGCAGGPLGLEAADPMHQELERLEAEQHRMAEQARLSEEAAAAERERNPQTFEQRLQQGDQHLAGGRVGEALWEYAAAHRLDPEAAAPRVRLGYVHLRHEPQRAQPLFESALELDPDYASAHTGLGLVLLASGEKDEGTRHLERGVELAPRSAQAQAALGVALDQTGQGERGIAHLEAARELAPHDGRIINNLGVAYLRAGDPARAEPLFRKALRQDTRDAVLRTNNLGMALALQGQFEEALELFRRGGDEQAARNNLGYAHFVRGELERAIVEYEKALVAGGDASVEVVRNLEAARRKRRDHSRGRPPAERVPIRTPEEAPEAIGNVPPSEAPTPPRGVVAERPSPLDPSLEVPAEGAYPSEDPWLRPAPPGALDPDA